MTGFASPLFNDIALPWVLDIEGGFVNDPVDRGGATQYGITQATLQAVRGHPVSQDDVKALTEDEAATIYFEHYWLANQCDAVPPALALCLFDAAVNHPPTVSRRLVQQGLAISADGIIGPVTLAAAHAVDVHQYLTNHLAHRAQFYLDLVRAHPEQRRFFRGWASRLFRLQHRILTMVL